jgi:hypothetical protein
MARALDWTKDRNRQLSKRAAAENIEELRQLHSVQWSGSYIAAKENKAANRAFAAEIAQYHQITQANQDPRGSWKISCEGVRCRVRCPASSLDCIRDAGLLSRMRTWPLVV